MLLGKEQLLQRPSLPTEDIDVPEFGGKLRVRAWTGAEYDEFGKAIKDVTFDGAMYAAAIAASAVSETGDRLFDMNGDIERIATTFLKTTLERAYDVIRRMNRLGKEGVEDSEKKLIEDGERRFWFFLSTRFGMPVCELKVRMPYAEFVEHVAYHGVEPWGDDWEQSATQSWASVAPHVKRRVTPQDFKPKPKRVKPQSPDYIFGFFKQLAVDAEARRKAKAGGSQRQ